MLEALNKIYENQQLKLPPLDATHTASSKGLLLRGMVELKPWFNPNGKKIVSLFIKQRGIEYLGIPIKPLRAPKL